MEDILDDPAYQPGFGFLLDRRGIIRPATSEYIHRMVRFIDTRAEATAGARWAVLVSDEASFGMGRMAEQISNSKGIRAFFDVEKAAQWLDSTEPCLSA